jgi:hypothetical protein
MESIGVSTDRTGVHRSLKLQFLDFLFHR